MQHLSELIANLRLYVNVPPKRERIPLYLNHWCIGSVEPDFLVAVQNYPALRQAHLDLQHIAQPSAHWVLHAPATVPPSTALAILAQALRDHKLCGTWRDERLAVRATDGSLAGSIERGATRPLGIATHAVHLTGLTQDGRLWLQRRSHAKSVDPGMWDTLVGGMVPEGESIGSALARESMEEAGLEVTTLLNLHCAEQLRIARPSAEGDGSGYLVETLHCYCGTVANGFEPNNHDGEVSEFACLPAYEVLAWIAQVRLTHDAALITALAIEQFTALGS